MPPRDPRPERRWSIPGSLLPHTMNNIKGSLEIFINMNKLKRAALQVIAEQLTEAELVGLRAAFDAMDLNKDGKLDAQVRWRIAVPWSCLPLLPS
jgi:hypothetical protein